MQKRLRQQAVHRRQKQRKSRNRPKTYDQVDMGQMALFDTAKDEDILKELGEMEIAYHDTAGCIKYH